MTAEDWKKLQNGSDIRGVAMEGIPDQPVNLTPEVARNLGHALVHYLKDLKRKNTPDLRIAVGTDSRISGPVLKNNFMEGIVSMGSNAIDVGLASTPAMFFTTIMEPGHIDCGVMLTASHLPFNRNGFKFFTSEGGFDKQDIAKLIEHASTVKYNDSSRKGNINNLNFIDNYARFLRDKIKEEIQADAPELPLGGFKIIVDAGNGCGGFFVEKVLKPLGADTRGSLYLEPDGMFPNHIPNPEAPEALSALKKAVLDNDADLGIIFDTDVDRAAVIDHKGEEVNRNRLIALMSYITLKDHPGSTIVTDSITSEGLTEFIENELKGKHHRYKRGYKNVINEAIRLNQTGNDCWLAIETSGHAAMRENYFLDDGAYMVVKILISMVNMRKQGIMIPDLISKLKEPQEDMEFRLKLNTIDFRNKGTRIIEDLTNQVKNIPGWEVVPNNYEGVRVSCGENNGNGWFLLRLSLHDPLLVLNIQSEEPGGVDKIKTILSEHLNKFAELDSSSLKK